MRKATDVILIHRPLQAKYYRTRRDTLPTLKLQRQPDVSTETVASTKKKDETL